MFCSGGAERRLHGVDGNNTFPAQLSQCSLMQVPPCMDPFLTKSYVLQVDMVSKNNHVLAVPMLRQTLQWQARLKGDPLAGPLLLLLADCCHRLRTHYANFILDRVCLFLLPAIP